MVTGALLLGQNRAVTSTFPLAQARTLGYAVDEVDEFLERARVAFAGGETSDESSGSDETTAITSRDIRHTGFRLVRRRGYSVRHVDAALERLEEAFAERERDRAIAERGSEQYYAEVRASAQEIIDRLARGDRQRFRRVGPFTRGYHPVDVDAFARLISQYFESGRPLPIETVRTIGFRSRYRGYHEQQVDLLLDVVIELMLAVR